MAKGFYIRSRGINHLMRRIKAAGADMEDMAAAEVAATAKAIERLAVQRAPNDLSGLRNSIQAVQHGAMSWSVVVGVHYAPYIEFGTGTKVDIPEGLERYAKHFMAPRPVKKEVNLPARPFFFPTYYEQVALLQKRLKELLT